MSIVRTDTKIEAVTFDVGGTLIRPWPSVGHIYAAVAARHGCGACSPEELNRRFAAAWSAARDFRHSRARWAALVDEVFAGLAQPAPSRTFFPELYEVFARPETWRVFPDAIPALERLASAGVRLAVISNWDERLRPLLRGLGLDRFFDPIIVSCEAGWEKPDPRIFQRAAEALRLPPGAILHVGDSPEMDVRGAEAAGFRAVLIERGGAGARPGRVGSLAEVEAGQRGA